MRAYLSCLFHVFDLIWTIKDFQPRKFMITHSVFVKEQFRDDFQDELLASSFLCGELLIPP